jgi:UDP-2,3-diacylglucosamine pyrophosphatase LpxH
MLSVLSEVIDKGFRAMSEIGDIIVISDLHLAPERGKGLFHADTELSNFFAWVLEEAPMSKMVLGGDILDFLVAEHSERAEKTLHPAGAPARTASIVEHHPEVFDALTRLANSPNHQVVIVGGNHDPELIFPEVQQEIALRLKQAYSHPPIRWVVNGEALAMRIGAAGVLIEHGDQYDNWNYIDHESLRKVVSLVTRGVDGRDIYKPPPGSALVINRFNLIRHRFPWIERLQPLSDMILPLILEVVMPQLERGEQFALWGAVREFARTGRRSLINKVLRGIKPEAEFWADQDEGARRFIEWQAEIENEDAWGKAEPDFARIIQRLRRVSRREGFFDIDEHDETFDPVTKLIKLGNDVVIHGHTHSAKAYKVGKGLYLNSGTWGQLMRLPASEASDEEWKQFLNVLSNGEAESFSRPTFIHVATQGNTPQAMLCEWAEGAPEIRSAWRFEANTRQWNQEG